MPNIVYVLTNPAMPGIAKIGMTDRPNVQQRMADLYTTGVPLPFDCVIAREIEGRTAAEIERALHTAFGPSRISRSREFFQIDPEQVEVLLRVMPGRDVTPQDTEQLNDVQSEDREASLDFKRRQSRTNEQEFLESLSENGTKVYEGILALGRRSGMRIKWGVKGFSLNAISNGALVVICYGYPPSAYNQKIYTDFDLLLRKSNIPRDEVEALRRSALESRLFAPVGMGSNLACQTDRTWNEEDLTRLIGWLGAVVERVRQFEVANHDRSA